MNLDSGATVSSSCVSNCALINNTSGHPILMTPNVTTPSDHQVSMARVRQWDVDPLFYKQICNPAPEGGPLLTLVTLPYREDPKEQKTVIELEARKYIPVPASEVQPRERAKQ